MNQLLKDLTKELYRLNNLLNNKALSKEDIAEEEKNLEKFVVIQKKLSTALKNIKKCQIDDENRFCEDIIELHVLTSNLASYFENLNEKIQKIIKKYPFSKDFLEKNAIN